LPSLCYRISRCAVGGVTLLDTRLIKRCRIRCLKPKDIIERLPASHIERTYLDSVMIIRSWVGNGYLYRRFLYRYTVRIDGQY